MQTLTQDSEYFYWPKGLHVGFPGTHFSTAEFACKCTLPTCTGQRASIALVQRLEGMRTTLGMPLSIHSGFRCSQHQQELRDQGLETAVGTSQHELGNAADVSAPQMAQLLTACKQAFKAVGAARSFIHVDLRSDRVRYWSYLKV